MNKTGCEEVAPNNGDAAPALGISVEITFNGPTFYDQEDEELFFGCISQLPGFEEVKGRGKDLSVRFEDTQSEQAVLRLLAIFVRWRIDSEPLSDFRSQYRPESPLWRIVDVPR